MIFPGYISLSLRLVGDIRHIALVDRPGSLGGVVKHHAQRGVEHDLIFTEQRRVTLAEDVGLVLLQIVDVVRITLARQRVDRESFSTLPSLGSTQALQKKSS